MYSLALDIRNLDIQMDQVGRNVHHSFDEREDGAHLFAVVRRAAGTLQVAAQLRHSNHGQTCDILFDGFVYGRLPT